MDVTELGMVTDVILEPDTKPEGSTSTLEPIVTWVILDLVMFPIDEQFLAFQINLVSEQLLNASFPMEMTEEPIVTLASPVQSWNALSPISVTELGMVTLVSPVQLSNALYLISVTELGMVTLVSPVHP